MSTTDIFAGLDAWLASAKPTNSATTTTPAPDPSEPMIGTVPASGQTGLEDMTVRDLMASAFTTQATVTPARTADLVATISAGASWRSLADAYYRHHFGCLCCIAAGQNPQLRRCVVGRPLWDAYRAAFS